MGFRKPSLSVPSGGASRAGELVPEDLLRRLDDPDPNKRCHAARALAGTPEAAGGLIRRLQCEPQLEVRETIVTSLLTVREARVAEELVKLLDCDDAWLRNAAIEILQHMPDEAAVYIERLMRSENADLRIFAVNVMEALSHPRLEEWLKEILLHDPSINVVGAALNLLHETGFTALLPAMVEVRRRFAGEPFVDFACEAVERRLRGI